MNETASLLPGVVRGIEADQKLHGLLVHGLGARKRGGGTRELEHVPACTLCVQKCGHVNEVEVPENLSTPLHIMCE